MVRLVALSAVSLAAAACGASSSAPSPAPSPTSSSSSSAANSTAPTPTLPAATAIDIRLLLQQGLSLGLASNVLQSQLQMVEIAFTPNIGVCAALPGGPGASKLIAMGPSSSKPMPVSVDIYYDAGCAHPYIEETAQVSFDQATNGGTINDVSSYFGMGGSPLGTLDLSETDLTSASGAEIYGTGLFTPSGGTPAVSLGLACTMPISNGAPSSLPCSGGIAQSFPDEGVSLASLTSVTLSLKAQGSAQYSVGLTSSAATLETGKPGDLSISVPNPTSPAVTGQGAVTGSDAITGQAAAFALFPPTPTGWSVTDSAQGMTFSVQVVDNSTGDMAGQVASSSGARLAQLSLDRSGTGTVTYADGTSSAVTNWTLAG
ncbi:MAG TPA: hypothetical protein VEK76_12980 [Candidatus Binatia bacterium]|nr:hypothetical protein [Candidatus Binatia bacterium]